MRKARILLILGVWVTILPYLGFPSSWKDILSTLTGLVFIYFSYVFYAEFKIKEKRNKTFDNFSENNFNGNDTPEEIVAVIEEDLEPERLNSSEL